MKSHTVDGEKGRPRKLGDPAAIGNVASTSCEKLARRKRRTIHTARKKNLPKIFFAWVSVIFFCVFFVSIIALIRYSRHKGQPANLAHVSTQAGGLDLLSKEEGNSNVPELKPDEAIQIVTQALANRDPELMDDYFILSKDSNPQQAIEELIRTMEAEGEIIRVEWGAPSFATESVVHQTKVVMQKDGVRKFRIAQLAADANGKWRVDFDAYLRKCIPPLAEVISMESGSSMVRVLVNNDNFYLGKYSDETKWEVYSLASPDIAELLYAYVKRGSSQHMAMQRITNAEDGFQRATLHIIKEADSGARQFEITRVISGNWVIGETNFDESFPSLSEEN